MSDRTKPMQDSELVQKWEMVFGGPAVSPFAIPRQMNAHAASVINLALSIQSRRDQKQTIAEVGVFQGILSRWLLNCLPFATIHLIDPWTAAKPGDPWYDRGDRFAKLPQEQFEAYYGLVTNLCSQFNRGHEKPRAIIHRQRSLDAVKRFRDGSLDLVFIDAAHDKQSVKEDIAAWKSKVRVGGYLCGHDYRPGGNYFGLVPGVEEAVQENGLATKCLCCKGDRVIESLPEKVKCPACKGSGLTMEYHPGKVWATKIA